MNINKYPIDPIIIKKRMAIPEMIAELSYKNKPKAIEYIRLWGEKKKTIIDMYDELYDLTKDRK